MKSKNDALQNILIQTTPSTMDDLANKTTIDKVLKEHKPNVVVTLVLRQVSIIESASCNSTELISPFGKINTFVLDTKHTTFHIEVCLVLLFQASSPELLSEFVSQ